MSWYGPIRLAHLNQMTILFMIMLQWMLKIFNEENHFSFHMKKYYMDMIQNYHNAMISNDYPFVSK